MNETMKTLNESDLQAYTDGQLDPLRLAEVEAWLAVHPDDAERVAAYRQQNAALHALFDPVLNEAIPQRLTRPERQSWSMLPQLRYAAVAAWLAIGGTLGWFLHGAQEGGPASSMALAHQAATGACGVHPGSAAPGGSGRRSGSAPDSMAVEDDWGRRSRCRIWLRQVMNWWAVGCCPAPTARPRNSCTRTCTASA